jgi:hypothetical protein
MSQANVDVVRRIYDSAARPDDVIPFEVYAENIVWDISNSRRALLAMKPVYHGHEGVRQYWRETLSAFGEIDLSAGRVAQPRSASRGARLSRRLPGR